MNSVGIFVKTLVALTLLWCIAENILPEKSIKKYSSYIYGLIVISMAVSVFTSIDYNSFYTNDYNMESVGYNNNYIKNLYEEKLETILREKFDDESIRIELTDECKIKNVYCDSKETYDNVVGYLYENN